MINENKFLKQRQEGRGDDKFDLMIEEIKKAADGYQDLSILYLQEALDKIHERKDIELVKSELDKAIKGIQEVLLKFEDVFKDSDIKEIQFLTEDNFESDIVTEDFYSLLDKFNQLNYSFFSNIEIEKIFKKTDSRFKFGALGHNSGYNKMVMIQQMISLEEEDDDDCDFLEDTFDDFKATGYSIEFYQNVKALFQSSLLNFQYFYNFFQKKIAEKDISNQRVDVSQMAEICLRSRLTSDGIFAQVPVLAEDDRIFSGKVAKTLDNPFQQLKLFLDKKDINIEGINNFDLYQLLYSVIANGDKNNRIYAKKVLDYFELQKDLDEINAKIEELEKSQKKRQCESSDIQRYQQAS